eukprot:scaffold8700_cov31-Tisochrysis_lutea.AAC.13
MGETGAQGRDGVVIASPMSRACSLRVGGARALGDLMPAPWRRVGGQNQHVKVGEVGADGQGTPILYIGGKLSVCGSVQGQRHVRREEAEFTGRNPSG